MLIKDQFRYLRWFIRKSLTNQTIMETDFETRTRPANMATKPKEGPVAKQIEEQTAKIPSDTFLWTAIGAMAVSLSFKMAGKNSLALFIGQWASPFLLFGIYNKLVKQQGHDKSDQPGNTLN
jgi:hypothetical protein